MQQRVGSGKFGLPFTRLAPSQIGNVCIDVNIQGMVNVAHAFATHDDRTAGIRDNGLRGVSGWADRFANRPSVQRIQGSGDKLRSGNGDEIWLRAVVRVNTVCPGNGENTAQSHSVWQSWQDRQPEENKLDLRRVGRAEN